MFAEIVSEHRTGSEEGSGRPPPLETRDFRRANCGERTLHAMVSLKWFEKVRGGSMGFNHPELPRGYTWPYSHTIYDFS